MLFTSVSPQVYTTLCQQIRDTRYHLWGSNVVLSNYKLLIIISRYKTIQLLRWAKSTTFQVCAVTRDWTLLLLWLWLNLEDTDVNMLCVYFRSPSFCWPKFCSKPLKKSWHNSCVEIFMWCSEMSEQTYFKPVAFPILNCILPKVCPSFVVEHHVHILLLLSQFQAHVSI